MTKILRNYSTNPLIYSMKKYVLVQFLQKFAIKWKNIPFKEEIGVYIAVYRWKKDCIIIVSTIFLTK